VLQRVEPEAAGAQRALPWEPLVAFGGLGALVAAALVAAASEDVAQYATARTTLVVGALTIAALALALVTSVVASE
jgi:hypothetical protein